MLGLGARLALPMDTRGLCAFDAGVNGSGVLGSFYAFFKNSLTERVEYQASAVRFVMFVSTCTYYA